MNICCFNRLKMLHSATDGLFMWVDHTNGRYEDALPFSLNFSPWSRSLLVCAVVVLVQYCMSMLIDYTLFLSALGCLHPASQTKCMFVQESVCVRAFLTCEGLNGVIVCGVVRTCGRESIRVCDGELRRGRSDEEILGLHSPRALPVVLATAEERKWGRE